MRRRGVRGLARRRQTRGRAGPVSRRSPARILRRRRSGVRALARSPASSVERTSIRQRVAACVASLRAGRS